MRLQIFFFISMCSSALLYGACSDSKNVTADASTAADSQVDTGVPASSCVRPGASGNEKGVGRFCTPGGSECAGPETLLCIATVEPDQGQWFCTLPLCRTTAECGTGAVCVRETRGSACVPTQCIPDGGMVVVDDGGGRAADARND